MSQNDSGAALEELLNSPCALEGDIGASRGDKQQHGATAADREASHADACGQGARASVWAKVSAFCLQWAGVRADTSEAIQIPKFGGPFQNCRKGGLSGG